MIHCILMKNNPERLGFCKNVKINCCGLQVAGSTHLNKIGLQT